MYKDELVKSIVAYNDKAAAADPIENPFFNMFTKEQNKGGVYSFEWTWAENEAKVRGAGNEILSPLAGTTGYSVNFQDKPEEDLISELFTFSFTKDNKNPWSQDAWETSETPGKTVPGSSILRFDYKGTAEIKNVKVTLKDAARLEDGATYHLKLVVRLKDAEGAESVVNTINVNVKKTMPTRVPKDFMVRIGQENLANDMQFFLRPYGSQARNANPNVWDITWWFDASADDYGVSTFTKADNAKYATAQSIKNRWATDTRPYNFEEIFVGLIDENKVFDENYKFVFPGCGNYKKDQTNGGFTEDAVSTFKMYANANTPWTGADTYSTVAWNTGMSYTGLNTDGVEKTMSPGYYLPWVYYGMMGKKKAVKVGYTYRNISFDSKNVANVDFDIEPYFFKSDGSVAEKTAANGDVDANTDAAFIAEFKCAIQSEQRTINNVKYGVYGNTYYIVKAYKNDGTTEDTGRDGSWTSTDYSKAIPYGNKFVISFDSVTVTWRNILGTYVSANDTKKASYFKTAFGGMFNTYELTDAAAYYTDTLQAKDVNAGKLYRKDGSQAKWIGFVGAAAPEITEVVIYNKTNSSALATLNAANNNLDRISDYFKVGVDQRTTGAVANGLLFEPKMNSLDPTEIGAFKITVKEKANTLKLIHQWGHESVCGDNGKTILVINPNSTPHIQ
jgi:hypothetical protein